MPVHQTPRFHEECRREQMSQRRETRLPVQLGLPGYLAQLCGRRHPASKCAGDVALNQYRFAPPYPHVRGFPALRVLSAGPTSSLASAVLRISIRSTYSVGFQLDQAHAGSLRFLDGSVSGRAVLSDPAAVSDHLAMSGGLLLPSRYSTLSARG